MKDLIIGKYRIKISLEPDYFQDSADNFPYDCVIDLCSGYHKTIALTVGDGISSRKAALIVPFYTPDHDFALPLSRHLFLMLNDCLCIFDPESLSVVKEKHISIMGTMFAAFPYEDDFILYGEMEILRVNQELEIIWSFSGREIFVRCEGSEPAFEMKADRICLHDFLDNHYEIDYEGKLIG